MSEFADLTLSFRQGDVSLTLRASNRVEMEALITDVEKSSTLAALMGATPTAAGQETAAPVPTEAEAVANLEKHLGAKPVPTEELASEALIKVAASKTGKSTEELAGITKAEAQSLIKEGSK